MKRFGLILTLTAVLLIGFMSFPLDGHASLLEDAINKMIEDRQEEIEDFAIKVVDFHEARSDWLIYAGLAKVIMHDFGWLLVKGLYNITSFAESLIPEALTMMDFLEYVGVNTMAAAIINDLVVGLMILTLIFLGYKTIVAKNPPKFKSVGFNIMMSGILIMGMPTLISTLQDLSTKFYESTQTNTNNNNTSSLAWSIIENNTADIMYAADYQFEPLENDYEGKRNNLTPTILKHGDMAEIIKPETIDELFDDNENFNYMKYRITGGSNGNMTIVPIDNGGFMSWFTDTFDSGYLRYPANFFPMYIGMASLTVAYLFTLFVFISTIIEIGFKRIVGLFVFATDLETGQRTKQVVQDIFSAFLLIAFTGLSFYIYSIFISYLANVDVNWLVTAVAHIAATVILIKGSSTILKYFGVDIGLKEGMGQFMATSAAALGAWRVAKGLPSKGMKTASNMKKIGSGAKEKLGGLYNSVKENSQNKRKSINGDIDQEKPRKLTNSGLVDLDDDQNNGLTESKDDKTEQLKESTNNELKNPDKKLIPKLKTKEDFDTSGDPGNRLNELTPDGNDFDKESINNSNDSDFTKTKESNEIKSVNDPDSTKEVPKLESDQDFGNKDVKSVNDPDAQKHVPNLETKSELEGTESATETAATKMKDEETKSVNDPDAQKHVPNLETKSELEGTESATETAASKMKNEESKSINNSGTQKHVPNLERESTNNNLTNEGNNRIDSDDRSTNIPMNDSYKGIEKVDSTGIQRVKQEIDKASNDNIDDLKQRVIKELDSSIVGTPDVKQKIVQDIESASNATLPQVKQNIERFFSNNGIGETDGSSIQKVFQEVDQASFNPKQMKQRVVQELDNAFPSIMSNAPLKQKVIQEVDEAFNASPSQVKQNVTNVVDKVKETTSYSNNNNYNGNKKSYFENVFTFDSGRTKSTRFERFDKGGNE